MQLNSLSYSSRLAGGQFGPAKITNVPGRVDVGILGMPTRLAEKSRLVRSIRFLGVAALVALPGGVAGINYDDGDSGHLRLIRNVGAELRECPAIQDRSLLAPSRYPLQQPLQVFKGNSARGVLRVFNDLLTDAVIYVSGKSPLLAPSPLEESLGRAGAFGLEFPAKPAMSSAEGVKMPASECVPIAIGCNGFDAEIDAKGGINILGFGYGYFTRNQQVKLPVSECEQWIAALSFEQRSCPVANHHLHDASPRECKDRHIVVRLVRLCISREPDSPLVRKRLHACADRKSLCQFAYNRQCQRSGQPRSTKRSVTGGGNGKPAETLAVDNLLSHRSASGVDRSDRREKQLFIGLFNHQLDLSDQLQNSSSLPAEVTIALKEGGEA